MAKDNRLKDKIAKLLSDYRPDDVILNQPGRALFRCIQWLLASLIFLFFPLGQLCLIIAQINAVNYFFANLAGLLLSGLPSQLFLALLVISLLVGSFIGKSRVQPPITKSD